MKYNGIDFDTYYNNYPDKDGYFGKYGGAYIDDKLKAAMAEITEAYFSICQSRKFIAELRRIRKEFLMRSAARSSFMQRERISTTPEPTSSIIAWVRRFSQNIWVRKRS